MDFLKSAPGKEPVVLSGNFSGSVDRVFRAWTDPDIFTLWFGKYDGKTGTAELDLSIGGRWRFTFAHDDAPNAWFEGEYTEIDANKALAFTWRHVSIADDGETVETPLSQVSMKFEASGAQTQINLRHEAIQTEGGRLGVGQGWDAALNNLQQVLERDN